MDFLMIMLAVLGIILLIVLIILCVRLNFTISRIDILLDDFEKKMKTVNRVFNLIDKVSDSVSLVSNQFVDAIIGILSRLFAKKNIEEKEKKEEEF